MNHNPTILSPEQLATASELDIIRSMYQYIVVATSLAFAILMFYFAFRFLVWFLPDRWYVIKRRDRK